MVPVRAQVFGVIQLFEAVLQPARGFVQRLCAARAHDSAEHPLLLRRMHTDVVEVERLTRVKRLALIRRPPIHSARTQHEDLHTRMRTRTATPPRQCE